MRSMATAFLRVEAEIEASDDSSMAFADHLVRCPIQSEAPPELMSLVP